MKFPCEIISEPYIIQLRLEAAEHLKKEGYSQVQIAELLQVSQPVVSGYLKKKHETKQLPDGIVEKAKEVGLTVAEILHVNGLNGIPEAMGIACNVCKILRQGGATCVLHKENLPLLEHDCVRCQTGKELVELQTDKQQILKHLRELFRVLITQSNIDTIIPEIGLQIVMGTDNMKNRSDIAGFPGRIIKRKRGAPSGEIPAFGSSERSSNLLLAIREYNSETTILAGIKTSDILLRKLQQKKISYKIIENFDQEYMNKLADLAETLRPLPTVIVDTGSVGFEAISYVLANSAEQLQSTLLNLI